MQQKKAINLALADIRDRPESALVFLESLSESQWDLSPTLDREYLRGFFRMKKLNSIQNASFLFAFALSNCDCTDIFNFIVKKYPPNNDYLKKEWKQALFVLLKLDGTLESNFLSIFNITNTILDNNDFKEAMLGILCKKDKWIKAVDAVIKASNCDWNEPIPKHLLTRESEIIVFDEKDGGNNKDELLESDVSFLEFAKDVEQVKSLIGAGLDINKKFNGITLREIIHHKPIESFNSFMRDNSKSDILVVLEKPLSKQWSQKKAWGVLEEPIDASTVPYILSICGDDSLKWRGDFGETFAHQVALYAPNSLSWVIVKASNSRINISQSKDNNGLSILPWMVIGINRKNLNSCGIISEIISNTGQFRHESFENIASRAKLALEIVLVEFTKFNENTIDTSMVEELLSIGNTFDYSYDDLKYLKRESYLYRCNAFLNLLKYNKVGNSIASKGWRNKIINAITVHYRNIFCKENALKDAVLLETGKTFMSLEKSALSKDEQRFQLEYKTWSYIDNLASNSNSYKENDWLRLFNEGVNLDEYSEQMREEIKQSLVNNGWSDRVIPIWERFKLQEKFNSTKNIHKNNTPVL